MTDVHPAIDLLLEDMRYFEQSIWRNDEIGEKRFTFFVSLVTAVIGGLAALYGAKGNVFDHSILPLITDVAIIGLILFGMLTYVRMLLRNRIGVEYTETLDAIRKRIGELDPAGRLRGYEVPIRLSEPAVWRKLKGGLAGTLGAFNAALIFLLLYLHEQPILAGALGVIAFVASWDLALRRKPKVPAPVPQKSGQDRNPAQGAATQYFRASSGALVLNDRGQVLVLERAGLPGAWQLPQGGIERSEEPHQAAVREFKEETGLPPDRLKLLGQLPEPLVYELPPEMRSEKTGRGQVQYWFVFSLQGGDGGMDLSTGGEFREDKWIPLDDLPKIAVEFRKPIYQTLVEYVRSHVLQT